MKRFEGKVAVISETGETIFEKDVGAQKAGEVEFSWDGKKNNTLPAKNGNYVLRVQAVDDKGTAIDTNPQGKARVIGDQPRTNA